MTTDQTSATPASTEERPVVSLGSLLGRESAGLPRWEVVGLEVLERQVFLSRGMEYHVMIDLHDVTPLPF